MKKKDVLIYSLSILTIVLMGVYGSDVLTFMGLHIADGIMLATAPVVIKLKKDGLTGDNLKFVEDLEKRFEQIPGIEVDPAAIQLQVREAMKIFDGIDATSLKALLDDKSETGLRTVLLKQGEELAKLKLEGVAGKGEDVSLRAQVSKWMDSNKDAIAKVKAGQRGDLQELQLRVAITMTNAASLGGSAYLPRIGGDALPIDLVRTQPTFWDNLTKGATKANPYYWVNKTNKQGNATFIGEGVLKNLASFELSTETSVPKKVAERMKASTELLYDVDGMASFIEQELAFEVRVKANSEVLTGIASSTNPKGVTLYASLYTQTGVEVVNPNNFDAVRAAIAQLQVLNFTQNIKAYVHPVDAANMDLSKSIDGVYVMPPFTTPNGMQVSGVPIIVDNNIAQGYLLIGDFSKYRVLMYQDFFVQWGWENDDFSKNLITIIGEMRFHQFVSANHTGAFIYDTFANIKAAIAAA